MQCNSSASTLFASVAGTTLLLARFTTTAEDGAARHSQQVPPGSATQRNNRERAERSPGENLTLFDLPPLCVVFLGGGTREGAVEVDS